MTDEKQTPPVPEGDGMHAGDNPGSGPTQSAHDYHPPHGHEAVEPDSPPMRLLTITIAVLAIVVIGTGIALGEWLSISARAEVERKQGESASREVVQLEAAGVEALSTYGYDEEKKLHSIPLEHAKSFLIQNPERVATSAIWSGLESLDTPEPAKDEGEAN